MNDCLFCNIIAGTVPAQKVYEDDTTYAFLDIGPVSKGHTLIVPKEHAVNLTEGSEAAATAMMKTVYKIAPGIVKALGASGYNLGMNHGTDAGQLVFHTHVHLMPRYAGEPRTFVKSHPAQEELATIAEQIRKEIFF